MSLLGRRGPTRSILPPLQRGPNRKSYSAQVTTDQLGDHPILYWSGELQPVTVAGSSPEIPAAAILNAHEWTAVLKYQAGGVARTEEWSWQPFGWQRTVMAAQVEVVARRVDASAAPRVAMTYGATLVEGAWQRDSVSFIVRTPAVSGSAPITQIMPQGILEFRAWQATNSGLVVAGYLAGGTFTPVVNFSFADLADWSPFPSFCNAVQYDNGGVSNSCIIQARV